MDVLNHCNGLRKYAYYLKDCKYSWIYFEEELLFKQASFLYAYLKMVQYIHSKEGER